MSQEIERREPYLQQPTQEPGESSPEGSLKGNFLLRLLVSSRRHWMMVLLIWVFVGLSGAAAIWLLVRPTYTASGFVKVEPATAILFPEVFDGQPAGTGFDTFLNTQAEEISSSPVLNAAIDDPALKKLPQVYSVSALREAVKVSVVPKTHLLRVGVTDQDPETAIQIARAILRAYKLRAGGTAAGELRHKREVLEAERERLRHQLELRQTELYSLAQTLGATSETTIDALRETLAKSLEEAHKEKTRAKSELIDLEGQLNALRVTDVRAAIWPLVARFLPGVGRQSDAKQVPSTMPSEDFNWREAQIGNDSAMKALRDQLDAEVLFVLRHPENALHIKLKADLEKQLEERRGVVAAEVDRKLAERRKQILDDTKLRLIGRLQVARQRLKTFQDEIDKQEEIGLAMGKRGLEIKRLQDELASIDRGYKIIDQSLSKIDIENRRADRITVEDSAEILPGDRDDKRVRLLTMTAFGALCFSMGLAFLRDLISGRLYSGNDVEADVGLQLLGSLPALEDLHRGRVNEEDFRESYRAIRATLAGVSPNGQVPKTVLVTSAQAAEGKTSLAVSLAASLAESGCRVLIIDGDVQAPRIAAALRLDLPFSLRHVLVGERSVAEAAGPSQVPGLEVLLAGRNGSSAAGLLTRRLAEALMQSVAERYDHVVIDSPPVLGSADALIWAQVADGVLLSSFAGHSSSRIMRRACSRLAAVGGRILGAVICNLSVRENYHSYSSYTSNSSDRKAEGAGVEQTGKTPRYLPYVLLPGAGASDCRADPGGPGRT